MLVANQTAKHTQSVEALKHLSPLFALAGFSFVIYLPPQQTSQALEPFHFVST